MSQSVYQPDEADRMVRAAYRYASRGAGLVWTTNGWRVVCVNPLLLDQVRRMAFQIEYLANSSALVVRNGQPQYDSDGYVLVGNANQTYLIPYKTGMDKAGRDVHALFFSYNVRASGFLMSFARNDQVLTKELRKVRAQVSANTRNIDTLWVTVDKLDRAGGGPGLGSKAQVIPDTNDNVAIVAPAPKPTVVAPEARPSASPKPKVTPSPKPPAVKKTPETVPPSKVATHTVVQRPRTSWITSPRRKAQILDGSDQWIQGIAGQRATTVEVFLNGERILDRVKVAEDGTWRKRTTIAGKTGNAELKVVEYNNTGRRLTSTLTIIEIKKGGQ